MVWVSLSVVGLWVGARRELCLVDMCWEPWDSLVEVQGLVGKQCFLLELQRIIISILISQEWLMTQISKASKTDCLAFLFEK